MTGQSVDHLSTLFEGAAVQGHLHAVDLATAAEFGHSADELVVLASVFKIPVLVELFRQVDEGQLDAAEPVTVPVSDRTEGPFGLSVMRDPAVLSWRDLAWLMMSLSDNAATDVICERIGIDRVNATLRELSLLQTWLLGNCQDLFNSIVSDLHLAPGSSLDGVDLTDPAVSHRLRAVDPLATSHSTPRDITTLLRLIWSDQAASPTSCANIRRIMGEQVWPHRLAAGFPEDDISTSGKTGTLPPWHNEAGVVEYADGGRYAVAVFTRSSLPTNSNPQADAAIARSARHAVETLREQGLQHRQPG